MAQQSSERERPDTRRPFTRADAVAAGVPPGLLRGSRFRRLFRGVYVDAGSAPSIEVMAAGALLLHPPRSFLSHHSAAALFGLPVPHTDVIHVSVRDPLARTRVAGIVSHVADHETRTLTRRGLPASRPVDMFIDLAGHLSLVDLVVLGDAMVRRHLVGEQELRDRCAESRRRGSKAARRAAAYVRAHVDSPMESRLRMLLVLAGLPEPEVNHRILDEDGNLLRRFDLSYPAVRVIVEYDGRQHADDPTQWNSDIDRREEFDDDGWRLIIVTSRGIYRDPERTIWRVVKVLRARGMRVGRPTDAWRPHFPER